MKTLRLLLFPLAATVFVVFAVSDLVRTVERLSKYEEQPIDITCEQLIAEGPPENRHVKITDCRYAEKFVVSTDQDGREWSYVLIPLFPANSVANNVANNEQLGNEKIRLVACIRTHNSEELEEFIDKPDVRGCVWGEFRSAKYFHSLLLDLDPNLDEGSYRVIFLGEEVLKLALANRRSTIDTSMEVWTISFGVSVLSWMVWMYRRKQRRNKNQDKNQEWFAKETADQPLQSQTFDPSFTQFEQRSEWKKSICIWATRIGMPAPPIFGGFYLLWKTEIISLKVGACGMFAGAFLGFACGILVLWIYRYYNEQTYKSILADNLPRAAKAYFEQETPRLESLGFVYLGDLSFFATLSTSVRLFLSDCGECLVTLESGHGLTAYNFQSIANDGTLLHTVSLNLFRSEDTPLPSRCQWTETTDLTFAFRQHMELMVSHVSQTQAPCLTIEPEFVIGVMDYAHRISGWSDLERGSAKKRLPSLPRAEQMVRPERGCLKFAWQARPNGVVFANDRIKALRTAQANYAARSVSYAEQSAAQEEYYPVGSEIPG